MHRISILAAALVLILLPAAALATDALDGEMVASADMPAYEETADYAPAHYDLEPMFDTYLGVRVVDIDGSRRAAEYDFLKTRPIGGFVLHYTPLPVRLDMELDFKNEKDLSAELSYAYRDLFLLDYSYTGLWHNLTHLKFREPMIDGINSSIDKDPGVDYGVETNDNRLFVRLKWPNMPYHAYVNMRNFNKDGNIQQRYMIGRFGPIGLKKYAQTREIDWDTRNLKAGINGHFGPVELEYQHGIKEFKAGGEKILVDAYLASAGRPAGSFEHNVVNDLERSWDTIKIHTASTGRIVGNLTLTTGDKNNEKNSSHVDFDRAATSWTFIPAEGLTVSLKYRHDRLAVSNQNTVFEVDAVTKVPTRTLKAIDSISRETDVANLLVRYAPSNDMNVKAEYCFNRVSRDKSLGWIDPLHGTYIPDDTNMHTAKVSVWARPASSVDVRVGGLYSYSTDPAYPTSYRTKVSGNVKANWRIMTGMNFNAYYKHDREENPFDFPGQDMNRDRHVTKDNAGAVLAWMPLNWLSTTGYYNFFRTKIKHTLTFEDHLGTPFLEQGVPYRDVAHVYGVSADTALEGPLNFSCEFHQSLSRGRFATTAITPAGNDTTNIPGMTNLKLRETGGSLTTRYDLPRGWDVNATYEINNFVEVDEQIQTGSLNGTAHSGIIMVSKTW